jgi:hypothetical protein
MAKPEFPYTADAALETAAGTLPLPGAVPCCPHAVLGRDRQFLISGRVDQDH